ncbi:hypothetical protein J6P59_02275 [bacterium]|nr:hypothetical protein [bacterium]
MSQVVDTITFKVDSVSIFSGLAAISKPFAISAPLNAPLRRLKQSLIFVISSGNLSLRTHKSCAVKAPE